MRAWHVARHFGVRQSISDAFLTFFLSFRFHCPRFWVALVVSAGVLLIISTFLIVAADLCTVVIAAWMEALSVTHHKEGERVQLFTCHLLPPSENMDPFCQDVQDAEIEARFMRNLLSMIQTALMSQAATTSNTLGQSMDAAGLVALNQAQWTWTCL